MTAFDARSTRSLLTARTLRRLFRPGPAGAAARRSSGGNGPSPAHVRRMVERLAAVPALRPRYHQLSSARGLALADLPELTRADVRAAVASLLVPGEPAIGGYLYLGGGTVEDPELVLVPQDAPAGAGDAGWWPVRSWDIVANLFVRGRSWSTHEYYNTAAIHSGALVLPFGTLRDDELDRWLDFFETRRVSALAAAPSTIRQVVRFSASVGRPMSSLRKLLWADETYDEPTAELVARQLPHVQRWGTYSAVHAGVIGHNGPTCAASTFHPARGQYIEVVSDRPGGAGRILVTAPRNTLFPLLRYDYGDRGELTTCPCGRPGGVRIIGRTDSSFPFHGRTLVPEEVVDLARQVDDVVDAQLVLVNPGTGTERIELHIVPHPLATVDPYMCDWVRHRVVSRHIVLEQVVAALPESFDVVVTTELAEAAAMRVERLPE